MLAVCSWYTTLILWEIHYVTVQGTTFWGLCIKVSLAGLWVPPDLFDLFLTVSKMAFHLAAIIHYFDARK